jgi:hypothetical protein
MVSCLPGYCGQLGRTRVLDRCQLVAIAWPLEIPIHHGQLVAPRCGAGASAADGVMYSEWV